MSLYVNPDRLEARLPSKDGGWAPADLIQYVTDASEYVDDSLPNYWQFPDYNDATPTPQTIQAATLDYAVYLAIGDLGEDNEQAEGTAPERRRERCDQILADLAESRRQIKPVPVSGVLLAFGTDEDYLDLAFLPPSAHELIEEATQITGYEYGKDFRVDYSTNHRAWYVERLTSAIVNDMEVSYENSWLRRRERDEDVTRTGSIEVFRA